MAEPDVQFAPAQAQRWNILGGFAAVTESPSARKELWGWAALSILALAVAGVFAALLALSRTPGVQDVFPWPLGFFKKGLVIHVVFSFVVWFLGVFGALTALATLRVSNGMPRAGSLGTISLWAAAAAVVLLFVPAFLDRGEATLNDYIPVIVDPLYYAGLGALGGSIALSVVRLLVNLPAAQGARDPVSVSVAMLGMIYGVALLCVWLAYGIAEKSGPSYIFNEDLFWGGGHALQFLNVGLLLVAWYVIGGLGLERPVIHPKLLRSAVLLLALLVLPMPFLYFAYPPYGEFHVQVFTDMQYGLAVPAVGFVLLVLRGMARQEGWTGLPWKDPAFLCFGLSVLTFGVGGILGLFVDGADTRTPAHYHGVIAGVNLAFMGLFYRFFLPLLGLAVRRGKALFAQIWLYGGGQVLAAIGLFLAGGYGAPRKTAGAAQGLEDLGAIIGMVLNGVGALIAVMGGIMFIWTIAAILLRSGNGKPHDV